eukprot:m.19291 g.19291  ORF g.19291 m.19291 type:complete len:217 (-) comp6529_c0_seq1:114-764(-)
MCFYSFFQLFFVCTFNLPMLYTDAFYTLMMINLFCTFLLFCITSVYRCIQQNFMVTHCPQISTGNVKDSVKIRKFGNKRDFLEFLDKFQADHSSLHDISYDNLRIAQEHKEKSFATEINNGLRVSLLGIYKFAHDNGTVDVVYITYNKICASLANHVMEEEKPNGIIGWIGYILTGMQTNMKVMMDDTKVEEKLKELKQDCLKEVDSILFPEAALY